MYVALAVLNTVVTCAVVYVITERWPMAGRLSSVIGIFLLGVASARFAMGPDAWLMPILDLVIVAVCIAEKSWWSHHNCCGGPGCKW